MLDLVKQLFENNVISEEMKSEIETAWQTRIQENRDQVTAELREEFAQKYEHDKATMVEAVETMLEDRLQAELGELAEDRQGLIEAKAKYAKKMKDDAKKMEEFVLHKLVSELSELHEDRKRVASNVAKLESFIVDSLAKEIAEFHIDKKDLAETKVKLVRESKAKFAGVKKEFLSRSAVLVKEAVETSHLNEKSETAKLLKVVKTKEAELEEAAKIVAEHQRIVESKDREIRIARDLAVRKDIMSELLGPLAGDKKTVMNELLESVATDKLRGAYDKYLPAVIAGEAPKKKALTEGKEITGDKEAHTQSSEGKAAEIFTIRKLAGLKV